VHGPKKKALIMKRVISRKSMYEKCKAYAKSTRSLVAIMGLARQAFVSWQNVKGDT
jgi:hypothetical protein